MRKVLMSMILMLLLAVCVGTASAAVTVTTSFGADNPAFGSSSQQASDPNSDDDDDLDIYDTSSIPLFNDGASNVTVDGVSFTPEAGFSIEDLNITIVASVEVPTNGSVSVSLKARIPETLDAVNTNYETKAFKVATVTLKSGSANLATFDAYMQRENNLIMKRAYVIVNEDSEKVSDGDKVDQVKPGSNVEVKVEAENKYKDNDDVSIEDVEMTVLIDDRDLDIDDYADIGDISPEDVEESSVNFDVDSDTDDGSYTMVISLEGEDEFNSRMGERIEIKFKVDKERHDLQIDKVNILPADLECGQMTTLTVKVTNIGKEDEEDAVIEITNDGLEYYSRLMGLSIDSGDSMTKVFNVPIPGDTLTGMYSLSVKTYWEMGEMTDVTAATLSVTCNQQEEEEEEPEEEEEEEEEEDEEPEPEQETQDTTTAVPVTTTVQTGAGGSSLTDSPWYLGGLIAAIIIIVAAIAVVIVKMVIRP